MFSDRQADMYLHLTLGRKQKLKKKEDICKHYSLTFKKRLIEWIKQDCKNN